MNNPLLNRLPKWKGALLTMLLLIVVVGSAEACPGCKETIAGDNSALSTGFSYSVLGMMSMPFLLVALVAGIVVRAYRRSRLDGNGSDPI